MSDSGVFFSLSFYLIIPFLSLFFGSQITGEPYPNSLYVITMSIFGVFMLFYYLLEAPTVKGRKLMDEIEGYYQYLSVAEKDRMDLIGKEPEMTEELFEKHLPFAMALGVESLWSVRLSSLLASSMETGGTGGREYQPGWYNSSSRDFRSSLRDGNFAGKVCRGISSSVSAASNHPSSSSSSGSSGGGSSGGGGGGGGGGGW